VYEINRALQVVRTFETGGSPQGIALSSDGSKLFIAAEAGDVIVWDIATNARVGTITTGCQGYGIVRTPDNSRLYVSCDLQGLVVAVNPTTGAMIATLNVGGGPRSYPSTPPRAASLSPTRLGGWISSADHRPHRITGRGPARGPPFRCADATPCASRTTLR